MEQYISLFSMCSEKTLLQSRVLLSENTVGFIQMKVKENFLF